MVCVKKMRYIMMRRYEKVSLCISTRWIRTYVLWQSYCDFAFVPADVSLPKGFTIVCEKKC